MLKARELKGFSERLRKQLIYAKNESKIVSDQSVYAIDVLHWNYNEREYIYYHYISKREENSEANTENDK